MFDTVKEMDVLGGSTQNKFTEGDMKETTYRLRFFDKALFMASMLIAPIPPRASTSLI
jgi:hypothetical protein